MSIQKMCEDCEFRPAIEGEDYCPECRDSRAEMQRQSEYWKAEYDKAPLSERDPEAYEEQMRDAGRGHLLGVKE